MVESAGVGTMVGVGATAATVARTEELHGLSSCALSDRREDPSVVMATLLAAATAGSRGWPRRFCGPSSPRRVTTLVAAAAAAAEAANRVSSRSCECLTGGHPPSVSLRQAACASRGTVPGDRLVGTWLDGGHALREAGALVADEVNLAGGGVFATPPRRRPPAKLCLLHELWWDWWWRRRGGLRRRGRGRC